jgi:hypothetical protein
MRRGQARVEKRKLRDAIVEKCHPAIFDLAQLWKEHIEALRAFGQNPPRELIAKLEAHTERQLEEIHRRYSGTVPPDPNTFAAQTIFSKEALAGKTDEQGIAELLHWERHKTPLVQDVQKMEARNGEAARRVLQTGLEYEALRCEQKRPKPFKGNLEHSNMFETLYGFGLERLTSEELAEFFDTYCPCETETHDPDSLRKHRARFERDLKRGATAACFSA